MTVPRALLLVLALLQAAGIVDLVRREVCAADCARNGCDDCTPGEDAPLCPCHCPGAPMATEPAIAVVTPAPELEATDLSFDHTDRDPASPEPREILHVPRLRAA